MPGQCMPQSDDTTTMFVSLNTAVTWCCQGTP
jgi:hypothetical protein